MNAHTHISALFSAMDSRINIPISILLRTPWLKQVKVMPFSLSGTGSCINVLFCCLYFLYNVFTLKKKHLAGEKQLLPELAGSQKQQMTRPRACL